MMVTFRIDIFYFYELTVISGQLDDIDPNHK